MGNGMKIFTGNRGNGKSTKLIEESANTGYPIVCKSKFLCGLAEDGARKAHLDIPTPVSLDEIEKGYLRGRHIDKVYIDEPKSILELFLGVPVAGMAVCSNSVDIGNMKFVCDNERMVNVRLKDIWANDNDAYNQGFVDAMKMIEKALK